MNEVGSGEGDSKKQKVEHNADNDSSGSSKAVTCSRCGRNDFASRNKLFRHLKFCTLDFNPFQRQGPLPQEEFNTRHDAYIYVTGGRIRGKTLGCVERFSFRTGQWEACPPLLENRGSHGSAALGDTLYVVGGGGFKSNLASNEKLISPAGATCGDKESAAAGTGAGAADIEASGSSAAADAGSSELGEVNAAWTYVRPMPTSRHALAVISAPKTAVSSAEQGGDPAHDVLYAIGGWIDGSICSTHLERYCPAADEWTECAPMKVGRRLMGAAYFDGRIFAFGGNCDDGVWNSDSVEVYHIDRNEWSAGAKLPIAGQCSAITVDDFIYVFIHGHQLLRYCPRSDSFTQLNEQLPLERWFCFDVTTLNKKIYLHGGNVDGVWSNYFFEYDVYANQWKQLGSMNKDRRRCSAAVVMHSG